MRNLYECQNHPTSSTQYRCLPVFEINGGTVVEREVVIIEDSVPVANTPLAYKHECEFHHRKNDLGAYSVAAAHEHLRLLLCPFLALALLWHWCPCGTMFVFVGRDFAHLASLFWHEW